MAWIYALADPVKPSEIRYIGRTRTSLGKRLKDHLRPTRVKCRKKEWINQLVADGKTPAIWPLEMCDSGEAEKRETFWVDFFRPIELLTNARRGGCGGRIAGKKYPISTKQLEVIKRATAANRKRRGYSEVGLAEIRRQRALKRGKGFVSEAHKQQLLKVIASRQKPVKCIETEEVFPSLSAAQRHIGIRKIFAAIKRNGTCGGKHWVYV